MVSLVIQPSPNPSRFVPQDVLSDYAAITAINNNFDQIASWIDLCVLRSNIPNNALLSDLNVNNNRLVNVANAINSSDAINLGQAQSLIGSAAQGPKGDPGSPGIGYGTRTAMAARAAPALLDDVYLTEAGREGMFVVDLASNWTAGIAADTYQGLFVLSTTDATKVYVRKYFGAVHASWFGFKNGPTDNAERFESIIAIFNALYNRGCYIMLPSERVNINREILITRPCRIEGGGPGGTDFAEYGSGPTIIQTPAGSNAFHFKTGTSPDGAGGSGSTISNLWIRQTGALGTSGTGSYNVASPTTITLAAAGDFQNGQIVLLEGASEPIQLQDRGFSTTAGSAVVNWVVTSKDQDNVAPYLGNAIGYVGQHIDIAGAGFPTGTTIASWGIGTATLSNVATSTVSNAVATIKCPLIAEIKSGGGTTTLTIDDPTFGQTVTNAVIRHCPAGIYIETGNVVVRDITVYYDVEGMGAFIRGATSDGVVADNNQFYSCYFGCRDFGVVLEGFDSQVNDFHSCNFAGPRVGILDNSLLGNTFVGGHWAFNCGIMVARYSAQTKIIGGYMEAGTSYIAPSSSSCMAFNTTSMTSGSGWQVIWSNGPANHGIGRFQRITSSTGAHLGGNAPAWINGNVNNYGGWPVAGLLGAGWAIGGNGVGGNAYQVAYSVEGGAYCKGYFGLTEAHWGTTFGGSELGTLDSTGYNLGTAGMAYKINGIKIIGARDTGWVADSGTAEKTGHTTYTGGTASATYLQSEITAIKSALQDVSRGQKAIKDALMTHGLLGA
jgi:hypothetical protein